MATPSVTHTFTSATTILAAQMNQNFSDLVSALTDTTADFSIGSITVAGATTLNGAVTLGNATSDDITVTGYIASDVIPKTANTYDLGSSTLYFNSSYIRYLYADNIESRDGTEPTRFPEGLYGYGSADSNSITDDTYEFGATSKDTQLMVPNANHIVTIPKDDLVVGKHFYVVNRDTASKQIKVQADNGDNLALVHAMGAQLFISESSTADAAIYWTSAIPAVTEWVAFTPVTAWTGANTTWTGYWRRVGQNMEVYFNGAFTGAPSNVNWYITLPSVNYGAAASIDSSVRLSTYQTFGRIITRNTGSSSTNMGQIVYDSGTTLAARFPTNAVETAGAGTFLKWDTISSYNKPFDWASGDTMSGWFSVPVDGWNAAGVD